MRGSEAFGIGRAAGYPFHAKVPSGSRTSRRGLQVSPASPSPSNLQLRGLVSATSSLRAQTPDASAARKATEAYAEKKRVFDASERPKSPMARYLERANQRNEREAGVEPFDDSPSGDVARSQPLSSGFSRAPSKSSARPGGKGDQAQGAE